MGGLFGSSKTTTTGSSPSPETALTVQTSLAGVPLPFLLGTNRIGTNMIWRGDFRAVAQHSSSSVSGGKGGGGGGGDSITGYEYYASLILALCVGPVAGVLTVWSDKDKLGSLSAIGGTLLSGVRGQAVWSYLASAHPDQTLAYSKIAAVALANGDLGASASMPSWTYEVCGQLAQTYGGDASPADVIAFILTDPFVGLGLPSPILADTSIYRAWCSNLQIGISPYSNSQTDARDYLKTWLDATCANLFWSNGQIKVLPYGDSVPSAFTGSLVPVWSFGDNDYMPNSDEEPIEVTVADPSNLYNRFTVEYAERANNYNANTATSDDPAHIDTFGLRSEGTQNWHFITVTQTAQLVADLRRLRQLGVQVTYVFTVGTIAAILEPMDIISITDSFTGLESYPVRITKIEEISTAKFKITAEDVPGEMAFVESRPAALGSGYSSSYGAAPGSINAPVIFEPPLSLAGDLEVWIAASSDNPMWGGCRVLLSTDGASYRPIGKITASARQATLFAALPAGGSIDATNGLAISMESAGTLSSVSESDWASNATLSYVDGELIAYQTASLETAGLYLLTNLRRGLYGSAISAHDKGSAFARLDDTVFRYAVTPDQVGTTVYLKFTSFNVFGVAEEDLADVAEYSWHVTGSALTTQLPEVASLTTAYIAGILQFAWGAYTDPRALDTEIRMGKSWSSGQVVGRFSGTTAPTWGDGTYWVSAHYTFSTGATAIDLYSPEPVEIVVAGSQLVTNVIAAYDEAASGWTGALTGLIATSGKLELCGAGDIEGAPDVLTITDIIGFGGMVTSGTYQVPASHRVNIGRVAACPVTMTVLVIGDSLYDNVLTVTDITQLTDVAGDRYGPSVAAIPQLRLSLDGVTWGAWQNWVGGSYSAMAFDFRLLMSSSAWDVTAIVSRFAFSVDVPDRVDTYNVTSLATGTFVSLSPAFNGGPNEQPVPFVSATIVNGSAGDSVQVSGLTLSGCTVTVYNSAGIATAGRTVHLIVQGY